MLTNLIVSVTTSFITNFTEVPIELPNQTNTYAIEARTVVTEVLTFEFEFAGQRRISTHEKIVSRTSDTLRHRDPWEVIGSTSWSAPITPVDPVPVVPEPPQPVAAVPTEPFTHNRDINGHDLPVTPPQMTPTPPQEFTRRRSIPTRIPPPPPLPPTK